MERLIYTSHAVQSLRPENVFDIIEASARNNPGRDLTGFLVHHEDRFFQLLEGPSQNIDALMAVLATDERHHSIVVEMRAPQAERWFPDWRMKHLISFSDTPVQHELSQRLIGKPDGNRVMAALDRFVRG